jgi:hypothetical protein
MWIADAGQVALGSAEPVEVTPASRVRHVPKRLEAKQRKTGGPLLLWSSRLSPEEGAVLQSDR